MLRTKLRRIGRAVRRVHDFEMELRRVEFSLLVGDHGDRRIGRSRGRDKTVGQTGDAVAVAHPHRVALADLPDAVGERGRCGHLDLGTAELAVMAGLDLAAELLRHGLLAVTDAEHRHAGLIDRHRRQRRVPVEHRCRSPGQDNAFWLHLAERRFRLLKRHDFAIDLFLAHPPRDELGDLRAEVDDENLVVGLRIWMRHRRF